MDGRNSPSYLLWAGMKLGALGNLGGGGKSCGRSAFYTPSHVSILKPLMLSRVTLICHSGSSTTQLLLTLWLNQPWAISPSLHLGDRASDFAFMSNSGLPVHGSPHDLPHLKVLKKGKCRKVFIPQTPKLPLGRSARLGPMARLFTLERFRA